MRKTIAIFKRAKVDKNKIVMLTAYDYTMAKLTEDSGIDCLLVGDSLGMVVKGYDDTLNVTIDEIIYHTKAVLRGNKNALVVSDMPFLSCSISDELAVKNAGKVIQEGGAQCVKIEGGAEVGNTIRKIIKAQIPVMGHLGFTPQSVHTLGGYYVQGKNENAAKKIKEDALLLQDAGVCAIVLEMVPAELATEISSALEIPTIGIGAGNGCDGQVLVSYDMFGMYGDVKPKFVKHFCNAGSEIRKGLALYTEEVKNGMFPGKEHSF